MDTTGVCVYKCLDTVLHIFEHSVCVSYVLKGGPAVMKARVVSGVICQGRGSGVA